MSAEEAESSFRFTTGFYIAFFISGFILIPFYSAFFETFKEKCEQELARREFEETKKIWKYLINFHLQARHLGYLAHT